MTSGPEAIVRRGGISKMVFVISLVAVAAVSGVTGFVVSGILHPSAAPVTTSTSALA